VLFHVEDLVFGLKVEPIMGKQKFVQSSTTTHPKRDSHTLRSQGKFYTPLKAIQKPITVGHTF
jgi:hypothetical protein